MTAINAKVIAELREISPGPGSTFLAEIIDLFLKEGAAYLERLREALKARDPHLLEHAAHTLKGSSGNLGAQELSRLSAELQNTAKSADWPRAEAQVAAIEHEFSRARIELEAEKAKA